MSEWISIEEKLPPMNYWVLVIAQGDPAGIIRFARAFDVDTAFEGTEDAWRTISWRLEPEAMQYYAPTHWMPRPNPPQPPVAQQKGPGA